MGTAFRLVVLEVLAVFLTVFDTASAAVLSAPTLATLVILFVPQVKTISTESFADFSTAIGIGLVLAVLAASRSYTFRIVADIVIVFLAADLTARVFVPRLASIRGSLTGHLR